MSLEFEFEHYDSVGSTNDDIRSRAKEGAAEGLVISADEQTKGKGRRGRAWASEKGTSVSTSLLLRPNLPARNTATITLVSALAATRMVEKIIGQKALIKWPNDVIICNRKVCGILCESEITQNERPDFVVVGIGINVHQTSFPEEISDRAISLDMAKTQLMEIHRDEVVKTLWDEFAKLYDLFLKTGDMSLLKEEYEKAFISMNKPVYIVKEENTIEAIARGIDNDGALLAEIDGKIEKIETGEVSVRGIYGYV